LLEGANQVSPVYAYRLVEGVLTTLTAWIAIVLDARLWVPTLSALVGLGLSATFLILRFRHFFSAFLSPSMGPRIQWRRELWPMQWKIALSWLSGYFSFSLFTPVLFHYQGAVVAGQMGMTWALAVAVSSVSSTWVYSKVSRLGMMVVRGEFAPLDRLIVRLTVAAVSVACAMSLGVWIVLVLLHSWGHPLASRVLPPLPSGLFLLATVLMQVSIPQSAYLRAHKKEPFLGLSLASGVLIACITWLLASQFNVTAVAAGYLCAVSVTVLVGTAIWNRCRSAWHNQESQISVKVAS
jgi:O-antigen/teichoic acid export membrane protein